MQRAAGKAKKQLRSNNPREAEKIIMSNRGLREARAKKGKGCAVLALVILGSSITAAAGVLYGAAQVLAAVIG